ncbi:transposase, partial [Anoxybacillus ayderensis]|uniref:ISL3 family transposase n=1 Tax=Anoxybacillus ayderensis TaxID=265546 RepID=UPI0003854435
STFKGSLQYHLPYTTVERWFYRYVPEQLPDQTATRVCVDEFALRKGHHYATSVLNTDTGHVLAVVPHRDRDQDAMETALSLANGNVKAVVSDLAPAIAKAVGAVFSDAIHVLDRFHIIQFFTDALKIRRRYLGEEKKHHPFRLIDRCLSSKPTRLTEEERQFVAQWLTEDEHTRHLYQALQHIRYVFQSTTVKQVKRRFSDWIKRYQSHVFGAVSKIAKRFVLREKAMIDTILSPLSNGLMEGVNNKIKLIKRRGPFLSVHSIRNRALIWSSLTFGDEQINLHKSKISLYILRSLFYTINTDIW